MYINKYLIYKHILIQKVEIQFCLKLNQVDKSDQKLKQPAMDYSSEDSSPPMTPSHQPFTTPTLATTPPNFVYSPTTRGLPAPVVMEPGEDETDTSDFESDSDSESLLSEESDMEIVMSDEDQDGGATNDNGNQTTPWTPAPEYGNHLMDRLKQLNRKFRVACSQVVLLNNVLEHHQHRYDRALLDGNQKRFRYTLRLRMSAIEGLRNMFYEYSCKNADRLDTIHEQMLREGVIEQELDLSALGEEEEIWVHYFSYQQGQHLSHGDLLQTADPQPYTPKRVTSKLVLLSHLFHFNPSFQKELSHVYYPFYLLDLIEYIFEYIYILNLPRGIWYIYIKSIVNISWSQCFTTSFFSEILLPPLNPNPRLQNELILNL